MRMCSIGIGGIGLSYKIKIEKSRIWKSKTAGDMLQFMSKNKWFRVVYEKSSCSQMFFKLGFQHAEQNLPKARPQVQSVAWAELDTYKTLYE